MSNNKLDPRFYPEIYQVVAGNNYTVYAYLNDGSFIHLIGEKQYLAKIQ